MPWMNKPYIETLAVMAKYNPFLGKAGTVKIYVSKSPDDLAYDQALHKLEGMGFNLDLLDSKRHNLNVI